MINDIKLKRCPFCGRKPELYTNYMYGEEIFHYYCPKCRIRAPSDFTKELAIERWNKRIEKKCIRLSLKNYRKDK